MELETRNFDNTNFKTIQFDTLDETNLKGIIWSPNYRFLFWEVNFEKKLKNLISMWKWQNWKIYYWFSVYLSMDIRSCNNIDLNWPFYPPKMKFCQNFSSNFDFFFIFSEKTTHILQVIWYFPTWSHLLYQIVYFWSL